MNQTIDLLKSHRSIRKYKDKPIDQAVLQTLIESGQWASTSSYVQAYSVIRVKNPEKREAMALLSGDQKKCSNSTRILGLLCRSKPVKKRLAIYMTHLWRMGLSNSCL